MWQVVKTINVLDNAGNTALHKACFNGHSDVVETLTLAGADETITNNRGKTQVAKSAKHSELLKLLDRERLMLTVSLMRQGHVLGKWCHTQPVVHIMMTIRSIIISNRKQLAKLKRKTNRVI